MYINDIHIIYYAIAVIASIFIAQIVGWANERLPEYKKVISKDFFRENKMKFRPHYILIFFNSYNLCNFNIFFVG